MTARGRKPRNDQRPTCWPCSADSSRNEGPSPRSFRYADTGVSQSAMNVWRTGTSVCSRDSSRVSSSEGVSSMSAAATLIQDLVDVGQLDPAAGQQDGEVVEHVRRLLRHALVGLVTRSADDLLRLLPDLRGHQFAIGQQGPGVGIRASTLLDRASERGKRLRRNRIQLAVVEAGALARVARRAGRLHEGENRVLVAVKPQLLELLDVPGGRSLVPQLVAGARPEPHLTRLAGALERLVVHVGKREHLAGAGVLDYAGQEVHGLKVVLRVASSPALRHRRRLQSP